jgi:hypothetical protein
LSEKEEKAVGKSTISIAVSMFFLLVPLHAVSKDLLPTGQTIQAPQKAVTPEGKIPGKTLPSPLQEIKPQKPPAPPKTTKPVIETHRVRNLRSVPAGEEVEVELKGRHLDRLTSAKVMDGPRETREIKVAHGHKTPTGWTLKLSGKKEALGKAGLRLRLLAGGQVLEVSLGEEIKKARLQAGLKGTPVVIPSGKQRELGKIKERERALETARPLAGGKLITEVVPSRGAAGSTVQIRGMNLGKPTDRFLWVAHQDTDGRSTTYSSGMIATGWSNTQITARIPEDAPEGTLKISVVEGRPPLEDSDSILSNPVLFTVLNPLRAAVSGSVGTATGISGVADRDLLVGKRVQQIAPSKTGVERVHRSDTGGINCGPDLFGIADQLSEYRYPVGYINRYDPGTQPIPCWSSSDSTYLTRVSFNFPGYFASRRVESAVLEFTDFDVVGWNREDCTKASVSLVRNDTAWEAGDRTVREHNKNWSVMKQNPSINSSSEFDITDWVRGWLAGTYPNHGVTILGRDYSYAHNNKQCAASIFGMKLTIRFAE